MLPTRRLRAAGIAALALLAGACSDVGGPIGTAAGGPAPDPVLPQGPVTPGVQGPQAGTPLLTLLLNGPEQVAFRGRRRVRLAYGAQPVEFVEEVACDGDGNFLVEAVEVLSGHPDPDLFLLWENQHPGATFRYRDFRVWDAQLFHDNYVVQAVDEFDPGAAVAGVGVNRLHVRRKDAPADHYFLVEVDSLSGLVLAWQEHSAGQLLADVAFTIVDLTPDLSGLALDDHRFERQVLDLSVELGPQVHFDVLRPALPPTGYQLVTAELMLTVPGDMNSRWLRLEYTDGADRTVFLQRPPDGSLMVQGNSTGTIRVLHVGTWTVLHGVLRGQQVICAGRAPEAQLLQMLQSGL